jgi:transcriptional regulator with XRE-family HTH domain
MSVEIRQSSHHPLTREDTINLLFGQRLAMARRLRKISQGQLAKQVNRSRVTIANLERGKHGVQLSQIFLFADALNASVTELLPDRKAIYEFENPSADAFVRIAKDRLNDLLRGVK